MKVGLHQTMIIATTKVLIKMDKLIKLNARFVVHRVEKNSICFENREEK